MHFIEVLLEDSLEASKLYLDGLDDSQLLCVKGTLGSMVVSLYG